MNPLDQLRDAVALDEPTWISAGSTIRILLQHIPELGDHTALFLCDERVVPLDHSYRNERALAELGLSVHGWGSHPSTAGRPIGSPRFAILGLGADGHVASCFPRQEALWALPEAVYVPESALPPKVPRVTVTPRCFAACEQVFIVAAGADRHALLEHCIYREANRIDVRI